MILSLPNGTYRLRILNPVTAEWSDADTVRATDEQTRITLPEFRQDWALMLDTQ